jgi:hypothetical protein
MVNSRKRGAILECKHLRYYRNGAPKLNERVYCPDCGDMKKILSWEGWYLAICESCRSSFTRSSLLTLARNARNHRCYRPSFRYWAWRASGWERISEKIVFALDSDPLWTDTDSEADRESAETE